jgi:hypothetical protein
MSSLFDFLDSWRHFNNYQLERRVDIFFSLFLVQALKAKLSLSLRPVLIPEFPVRIGTICQEIPIDNSYKINYVVLTNNNYKDIFVELKTKQSFLRSEQEKYLLTSQKAGFLILLQCLLYID